MGRIEFSLLGGLLAGAVGGFLVHLLAPPSVPEGGARLLAEGPREVPGGSGSDGPRLAVLPTAAVTERIEAALARIEALLQPRAMGSKGSSETPSLLQRIDQRLASLEERLPEAGASTGPHEPEKRRTSLAEAARELALSATEEGELRAIYDETFEKACALLATEGESAQDVRREIEAARGNEGRSTALTFKYLGRFMAKLPDVMALEGERQDRIRKAVGPEKAARLNERYDLEEANPLGMGGSIRVESRGD